MHHFRNSLHLWLILLTCFSLYGQEVSPYYKFSNDRELPFFLGSSLVWFTGFMVKSNSERSSFDDLSELKTHNLWIVDRGAVSNSSNRSAVLSDVLLFSSVALPITCYLNKEVGHQGGAVGMMFLESIMLTHGITNMIKGSTVRYRPYAYNDATSAQRKLSHDARHSFVSGHTSVTAAMTFLTAKVLTDLHPDSRIKPLIWAGAAIIPAATGVFRYQAGRHFPTDIIGGYALGAGIGLLVPKFHAGDKIRVTPAPGGLALAINISGTD